MSLANLLFSHDCGFAVLHMLQPECYIDRSEKGVFICSAETEGIPLNSAEPSLSVFFCHCLSESSFTFSSPVKAECFSLLKILQMHFLFAPESLISVCIVFHFSYFDSIIHFEPFISLRTLIVLPIWW